MLFCTKRRKLGSGITASILHLALEIIGYKAKLYDGSWAEYGSKADSPIKVYL